MPGPTRHSPPRLAAGDDVADRDATTESLLLTGLDFYFAGQYERAVHAWTRVLFIDRAHARARAYIDRARRVLAERQREADELLHGGIAAFDEGDPERARALLTTLVERGNADDLALALLQRMDRLEAAFLPAPLRVQEDVPEAVRSSSRPGDEPAHSARVNGILVLVAGTCLIVAALLVSGWDPIDAFPPRPGPAGSAARPAAVADADALPLPSSSELTLAQARALFARGHLHEALRVLESARPGEGRRAEVDALRAEIQRALIEAADVAPAIAVPDP